MTKSATQFARGPGRYNPAPSRLRRWSANFWLNYFFWSAEHFPLFTQWQRKFCISVALNCSKTIQLSTFANARRILGRKLTISEQKTFRREVVYNFFHFISDVALSLKLSREQLLARINRLEGEDKYFAARSPKRGAIIATIHMGSFEAAVASLRQFESHVHVVFKRDPMDRFEQLRSRARQKLGVIEMPVDDGWGMWVRLRDALLDNQVVMLQADRVMPGQKGNRMKFLGGHILMPTGPARLAMATGAPIIPIITTRTPDGRMQIHIEDAINVPSADSVQSAMEQLRDIIEKYVRTYPTQWLMLEPAFCEDQT